MSDVVKGALNEVVIRYDFSIMCAVAVGMVPLSIALIGRSAIKSIAANPEAKEVVPIAIVAMAFCESIALFCFGFIQAMK